VIVNLKTVAIPGITLKRCPLLDCAGIEQLTDYG
jgi:hypothetical protein